ncbi:hypothetical protein CPB84DRAFT_1841987 [Gymnopilus junonius]|uniref:DUF221-domain-containing protein n=1 Tax=Gymnopilus junonius TaxID=109634 RepID=A0A9P5NYX4_GYMJU|nr:hypothetical protein CPB84DRAFT_1841987 [Gymnopilus junonius]
MVLHIDRVSGVRALIPIDFIFTLSIKPPQYNILTAMTIQYVQGVRLYAHIGSTYLFTLLLMFLVYFHWRAVYRLRNEWFHSPEYRHLFYARTLSITNIPPRLQSDAGLYKIFNALQLPYQVTSVHIGRRVGALPDLIAEHDSAVIGLEQVLAEYSEGDQLASERPIIVLGGLWGMGGRSVDAIEYYTARIKHAEAAVQQYYAQLNLQRAENYGFATMASIPAAHAAARELRGDHPKGITVELAPNPKDIIWGNLSLSRVERRFRRLIGFSLLILFCILSLIPQIPVASLANLDAIAASGYIPFLQPWYNASPITYTIVSAVVPPAFAALFSYFLPRLMCWLSKYMGAVTYSSLERVVVARYFAFLVISQLIIFTILGVLFNSVLAIIQAIQSQGASLKVVFDNLSKLPARITQTYVTQSSFWLKWFPLQGFLLLLDLSQLFNLLWFSLRTRLYGRSPRDIREYSKPPAFDYALEYSNLLFMATIGLVFAPLAPLVSLAAAATFWLCSGVYKYQLVFVYVTRVETGGRTWNVVVNRMIFAAMFMQAILILTIALQVPFKSLQFIASVPPLLFLLGFKYYIKKRFSNDFQYYIPSFEELSRSIVHFEDPDTEGTKLRDRYGHPALRVDLMSPMVHSRTLRMLRRIYGGGTRNRTRGIGENKIREKSLDQIDVFEGVKFIPGQLEYDPEVYQRDREEVDHDFDSVNVDDHTLETPVPSPLEHPRFDPTLNRGAGHETNDSPKLAKCDIAPTRALGRPPAYHRHGQGSSLAFAVPFYDVQASGHEADASTENGAEYLGHDQSGAPQSNQRGQQSLAHAHRRSNSQAAQLSTGRNHDQGAGGRRITRTGPARIQK